ncbi:MAG: Smr/MutS family protein [Bryobacteraceae bacterium]|jgi:DNA mismatch repair protein MutS2
MNRTSLDLLEFEGLRQLLGRFVQSPLGRAELEQVQPVADRALLESTLADVREALEYVRLSMEPQQPARGAAIRVRFDAVPDVAAAARMVAVEGAVLEPRQILEMTQLLERAAEIRGTLSSAVERFPLLGARAEQLADLREVLRDLRGKILPDCSMADDASVALRRIRRDIEKQRRQIQVSLERFVRAHRDDGVLQEDFITVRNDRLVVPVAAGQQRHVPGVMHGASNTGHTLFIEPLETIDLNNEAVRLREEEQREVQRILRELTELLRAHAGGVRETVRVLGELDLLFAKANFAVDFGCSIPCFTAAWDRRLMLEDARHPLLEDVLRRQRKRVTPLSLTLEEKRRTLLISGPNTGGKTVSMKTVGLLSLMAQAGLPVPAARAEFPLFDEVLADIGDQQSIQENLSTFSAHIEHIRAMLEAVTRESLVLLDELGRATDPEEGGALGVAIVERFRASGAFTLASTHLLALKVYGANTEGVLNGSMGFDDATLEPTYVLRTGAPGKSAGLEIAGRLGMPPELIERARAAMTHQERDISRFLGELHDRIERTAENERELEREREKLAARERSLAKEWEQREAAKLREMEQRCDNAVAAFEAQARETIEGIARTAEGGGQRKAADQALRKVARTRREFQEEVKSTVLAAPGAAKPAQVPLPLRLKEGARVRLQGVREPARVLRKLSGDRIEVQAGLMKMQIGVEDVEEVLPAAAETSRLPEGISYQPSGPAWNVTYREINVIGKRAEEACDEVDKFLDTAAMASVDRVRIVHGHGMGILRKAIADLLAANPHVAQFYAASQAEGGTGATVVELK